MAEKEYTVYTPLTQLDKIVLCLVLAMLAVAFIRDSFVNRRHRREKWLAANLDIFPTSYRMLLTECGAYITDDTVQKYLQAISKGFEDSCDLLRTGQLARAVKRFDYTQRCVEKARESAKKAAFNAKSRALLLGEGDKRYDEVERSNALLEKRRRTQQ